MIVVYAEKEDMGIRYAAALGGIDYFGTKVTTDNLSDYQGKIKKEIADKRGYLKTFYNNKLYVVTWGWGHFGTLKDIKDYNPEYDKWYKIPLPFIPERFESKRRDAGNEYFQRRDDRQFAVIKNLFHSDDCEYIINATDWEREGELIFAYVYDLTGSTKPYYRLRNTAKTTAEIRKAFANIVTSDENFPFVLAARGRSISDWIIGINMTIAATMYLSPTSDMINIGRVQTPTLNLIVEREKAIRDFKPETTYNAQAEFTLSSGEKYIGKLTDDPDKKRENIEKLISSLEKRGEITSVEKKLEGKKPPLFYNTQTLQSDANKIYGFTLTQTLDIAQKLYENGYLTYPRVDSQYLTEDKKKEMPALIDMLAKMDRYKKYNITNNVIPDKYFNDNKVDGHDAIIITDSMPEKLTEEQAKIYDLVARRMLMSVSPNVKIEKTTIITSAADPATGEIFEFKTIGTVYKELGFQKLIISAKEKNDTILPSGINKGEIVDAEYSVTEQTSTPPSRFTDATLLTAMENCGKKMDDETAKKYLSKSQGIGRPATRAAILDRLINTKSVERQKKQLVPTEKGMNMIDAITIDDIKSPILTAKWEEKLDEIETSTPNISAKLLNEFIKDVETTATTWVHEMEDKKVAKVSKNSRSTGIMCPVCGNELIEGNDNYFCSGYKDKSCNFRVKKEFSGKNVTKAMLKDIVTKGKSSKCSFTSKNGKTFFGRIVLAPAYECESCGAIQVDNGKCYKCEGKLKPLENRKLAAIAFEKGAKGGKKK